MFLKICGVTNEEDALLSVAMGADAVGFIFAPSPRQVATGAVAQIAKRLPGETLSIGVFRNSLPERVIEIVAATGIEGVQLHGSELPADVALIRPYVHFLIKAFDSRSPLIRRAGEYAADALLIDSPNPGSGEIFDWQVLEGIPETDRLILAGGLTAENVGEAIARVRPWGIDVNSGVESAPGHKDPRKLRAFVQAVREAEVMLEEDDRPVSSTGALYNWQEEE